MIKQFRIGGSIFNIDSQEIYNSLSVNFAEMKIKHRIFGCDIEYIDNNMEFHINTIDGNEYLIQITMNCEEIYLSEILNKITELLLDTSAIFEIGYYEQDINRNQISKDVSYFTNPNYVK